MNVFTHASGSAFDLVHREELQRQNTHVFVGKVPGTKGRFDPARLCHSCKTRNTEKGDVPSMGLAKNQLILVCM